ncbi:MAG: hypothetical protein M3430_01655 [Acidobacteriota bacterium]|nr:hypothetical protein [Acidobacteriota bacterium]
MNQKLMAFERRWIVATTAAKSARAGDPFRHEKNKNQENGETKFDGERITEEETELAARLEYDEHLPRMEAEQHGREWFAPSLF